MRDHGLFQAICRVNRLDGEDKEYGYIIDYMDLFKSLEKAVADYTSCLLYTSINTGKKNNDDKVPDGIYPFFVRSKQIERIDTYSFDGEAIIIPGEGNIGEIFHYINGKFDRCV